MVSKKIAVAVVCVQVLLGALVGVLHETPASEVCLACIIVNVER